MELTEIYGCFSDSTRLRIINLLLHSELCVCHLQEVLEMSQVKMSKHLSFMRQKGLVSSKRYQNWMMYSLCKGTDPVLDEIFNSLEVCLKKGSVYQQDLLDLKKVIGKVQCVKEKV